MSFIAITPPPVEPEAPIDCGDFFPTIDPKRVRAEMRLDGVITAERLRAALLEAAATIIDELRHWSRQQVTAGHSTLADVPAPTIDGASLHVTRFLRAVRCLAAAELNERYRNYDSTDAGHQQADKLTETIDELRRDARWAISDIRGIGRNTVELI